MADPGPSQPGSGKGKGPARGGPPRPNRSASGMPRPGQSDISQSPSGPSTHGLASLSMSSAPGPHGSPHGLAPVSSPIPGTPGQGPGGSGQTSVGITPIRPLVSSPPGTQQQGQRISSSSMTKGGSIVHSKKKKTGKLLEDIWPRHFLPLQRRSFKEVADLPPIRVVYAWQPNDEDVSETEESQAKALLFQEVAKVFFVFGSSKLMGTLVKNCFPDLDTRTLLFGQRREYAVRCFNNFKHEFLWENLYSLANDFLNDHGSDLTGDFLVDPSLFANTENNMRQTKSFLYSRLDKQTFGVVWRPIRQFINWEDTFTDRDDLPFYYIKTIFCNLMVNMAQLILNERTLNPGVRWNVKHSAREWKRDDNNRVEISNLHEAFSVHANFREVELDTFVWKEVSAQEATNKRRASQLLADNLITDSPPPPRKTSQRHVTPGSPTQSPSLPPPPSHSRHGSYHSRQSSQHSVLSSSPLQQSHRPGFEDVSISLNLSSRAPTSMSAHHSQSPSPSQFTSPRPSHYPDPSQYGSGAASGSRSASGPGPGQPRMFQQPVPFHLSGPPRQSQPSQPMTPAGHLMTQSRIPTPIRPPATHQVTPVPPPIDPRLQLARQSGQGPSTTPQQGPSSTPQRGSASTSRQTRSSTKKKDEEEAGRGRGRGHSSERRGRSGGRIVTYDSAFDDDVLFYPDDSYVEADVEAEMETGTETETEMETETEAEMETEPVPQYIPESSESLSQLSDLESIVKKAEKNQEMDDTQTLRGNSVDIDDINDNNSDNGYTSPSEVVAECLARHRAAYR
ncbi:hypothetical protein CHU98_g2324 [Xylaria longipes]|nr:hypothetical protein CHU98_g2324 [Xylaria longipes]